MSPFRSNAPPAPTPAELAARLEAFQRELAAHARRERNAVAKHLLERASTALRLAADELAGRKTETARRAPSAPEAPNGGRK